MYTYSYIHEKVRSFLSFLFWLFCEHVTPKRTFLDILSEVFSRKNLPGKDAITVKATERTARTRKRDSGANNCNRVIRQLYEYLMPVNAKEYPLLFGVFGRPVQSGASQVFEGIWWNENRVWKFSICSCCNKMSFLRELCVAHNDPEWMFSNWGAFYLYLEVLMLLSLI